MFVFLNSSSSRYSQVLKFCLPFTPMMLFGKLWLVEENPMTPGSNSIRFKVTL